MHLSKSKEGASSLFSLPSVKDKTFEVPKHWKDYCAPFPTVWLSFYLSFVCHYPPTYLPTIMYQQNCDCQDIPQYAGFFPSMHITSPYFLEVRYAMRFALANGIWAQETLETFLGRRLTLTANVQLHMLSPLCHWDQDSSSYQPASQNKDKVVQNHPTSMLRAPAGWPKANV